MIGLYTPTTYVPLRKSKKTPKILTRPDPIFFPIVIVGSQPYHAFLLLLEAMFWPPRVSHLCKSFDGPGAEPVDDASVEQGRRSCAAALKAFASRVHGENYVEPALNLLTKEKKGGRCWACRRKEAIPLKTPYFI